MTIELWQSQRDWATKIAGFQGVTKIERDETIIELRSNNDLVAVISLTEGQWVSVAA